jgi:hypothetical protein
LNQVLSSEPLFLTFKDIHGLKTSGLMFASMWRRCASSSSNLFNAADVLIFCDADARRI